MRNKQREKAALQQKREREKRENRRKKKEAKRESPPNPFATIVGFLIMLILGWYFLTNHIGEDSYNYEFEPALAEPYYSWMNTISILYWVIGISCIIGVISFERSKPLAKEILILIILLLTSFGLLSTYPIALIKLNVPVLAFIYLGLILIGLAIYSYLSLTKSFGLTIKFAVVFILFTAVISIIFLFFADPTDGKYLMVTKGSVMGSFWTKLCIWVSGLGGVLFSLFNLTLKLEDIEVIIKK